MVKGYASIELLPDPPSMSPVEPIPGAPGWQQVRRPLYMWRLRFTSGTTAGSVVRIVFFRGDKPVAEFARLTAIG
jgi:hypothetical protein